MTNTVREQASDSASQPTLWYVYILQLDDGDFYIGQTNDLETRFMEHSLDAGAEATKGKDCKLVWFSHTHSRESACAMEKRLQRTLDRSPLEIETIVGHFNRLLNLIRPQKTLREIGEEQRQNDFRAVSRFHHVPVAFGVRKPTCGYPLDAFYEQGGLYGTSDWAQLSQMERERKALEGVGGKLAGRQACQDCLRLAPDDCQDQ